MVVAATVLALAFSLAIETPCPRLCLSDVQHLYERRDISAAHPPYLDRDLEYPTGVGALMWAAAVPARSARAKFWWTAGLLAAAAIATTTLLARRQPEHAWRFALAPPLALYAFHNWDLAPVLATVAGIVWYERRRDTSAGVALGLGAATKLYPALVALAIVVEQVRSGQRDRARRTTMVAAGTFAVMNVPVLIASRSGWWFPVRFQSARPPTWTSLWVLLFGHPGGTSRVGEAARAHIANVGSVLALVIAVVAITVWQWRRGTSAVRAAFVFTIAFVLINKVYSPQYDLWFLPWFVLLPLSTGLWISYVLADAAVFAITFLVIKGATEHTAVMRYGLLIAMLVRAAVLVTCAVRSRGPTAPESSPSSAQPRAAIAPGSPPEPTRS